MEGSGRVDAVVAAGSVAWLGKDSRCSRQFAAHEPHLAGQEYRSATTPSLIDIYLNCTSHHRPPVSTSPLRFSFSRALTTGPWCQSRARATPPLAAWSPPPSLTAAAVHHANLGKEQYIWI